MTDTGIYMSRQWNLHLKINVIAIERSNGTCTAENI
jgi:hypothetical protein